MEGDGALDAPRLEEARLVLHAEGNTNAGRAAVLLAPANPLRHGYDVTFYAAPHGAATAPKAVARLLTRLDAEGVLAAARARRRGRGRGRQLRRATNWLADAWDHLTAHLPEDWSDLYAQVDLDSSDYLEPAALNLAPVNPARYDDSAGFRFRSARRFGYGASPQMVQALLPAPGRERHHRLGADPLGSFGHEAGRDAGARLVPRGPRCMSDPVSWLLIERGWKVFGANGNEVGTVHEVTGDSGQDIFDGLSISSGTVRQAALPPR